ncbi:hypothetical protein BDK51DRAFT_39966 [Blyttiomyces helicus]|uniref:Uncharacterized protein n=1 Tax=Blyttiomyces helicus TaxID=388810 RepID=A0A4P9WQ84_9FUNG|nr:hypothetical protein BDK51DRAFT_39966 [Blyttiomyces helicus]|eukprot:RKO94535.1 hypothetical protein BDK51DRAFT_39966 [Blyttiomyces helicus]
MALSRNIIKEFGGLLIDYENTLTANSEFPVNFANTTVSVSINTGAVTILGGLGINGNITVGSTIVALGGLDMGTGTLIVTGGAYIGKSLLVGFFLYESGTQNNTNFFQVSNTTDAGEGGVGALNVQGGITVSKSVMVSGNISVNRFTSLSQLSISNTTDATSPQNGCAIFTGGIGIGKSLYAGSNVIVEAMVVQSGGSIGGSLYVGESLTVSGSSIFDSTMLVSGGISTTTIVCRWTDDVISGSTGSFQTIGGLSVRKSIFIGGNMTVTGNSNCLGNGNSAVPIAGGISVTNAATFKAIVTIDAGFNLTGQVSIC